MPRWRQDMGFDKWFVTILFLLAALEMWSMDSHIKDLRNRIEKLEAEKENEER
jgi:hypothetical protein